MPRVKCGERVKKTLIFKDSICGEYYKGKLHDYIYMEDEDGNEYVYPAVVGSLTGGELELSQFNPSHQEVSRLYAKRRRRDELVV
jgi:hypothetical protein